MPCRAEPSGGLPYIGAEKDGLDYVPFEPSCFGTDDGSVYLCALHNAAPKLLAALKAMVEEDDGGMAADQAKAAIAEATGSNNSYPHLS